MRVDAVDDQEAQATLGGEHLADQHPQQRQRETQAQARGGNQERIPLSDDLAWVDIDSPELLDLNRALDELGSLDAGKVQLVELRYFLGCTAEETAALLQVSKSTVDRELKFIKSWLYRRIHPVIAEDAVRL